MGSGQCLLACLRHEYVKGEPERDDEDGEDDEYAQQRLLNLHKHHHVDAHRLETETKSSAFGESGPE